MPVSWAGSSTFPRESTLAVYDALWAAGEAHGITDYGSFAMNAMRMEKMFKGAGELTNEVTLPEADVRRFAKLEQRVSGRRGHPRKRGQSSRRHHAVGLCLSWRSNPMAWKTAMAARRSCWTEKSWVRQPLSPTDIPWARFLPLLISGHTPMCRVTDIEVVIAGSPRKGRILNEPVYDPQSLLPRTDAALADA